MPKKISSKKGVIKPKEYMRPVSTEQSIRKIVKSAIEGYSNGFEERHLEEKNNPNGVINIKIHNIFIAALGQEIQYYSSLVRSLDSSMGNMLEKMAMTIAELFFQVSREVEGPLYPEQITKIAELLEAYKNKDNPKTPSTQDYQAIRNIRSATTKQKTHESDYCLYDKKTNTHHLIELKIGGDLDNKKARSEKEAIFEQYAILANKLKNNSSIKCHFATAYNRFGEDKEWTQSRVLQFFSKDELLIGKDFWNFICCSPKGYKIVIDEYEKNAYLINNAIKKIKTTYLG